MHAEMFIINPYSVPRLNLGLAIGACQRLIKLRLIAAALTGR